jgi:SWIM/SEC-C metal-binding protein
MVQLRSKKHPAIVHVKTQERAIEIMEFCNEHGWQVVVGIEPRKREDISDVTKLLALPEPKIKEITPGRNEPWPCGSGLKFKKCCSNQTKVKPLIKDRNKKWWHIWK